MKHCHQVKGGDPATGEPTVECCIPVLAMEIHLSQERLRPVQPEEEKAQGDLTTVYKCLARG